MPPESLERAQRHVALLKKRIARYEEFEEALRREISAVRLLHEVAAAANEAQSIEGAFQLALDEVCEFTGWPLGRLFRVEPDTGELILTSIQYCNDELKYRPFIERTAATISEKNNEWLRNVVITGKPQWITDVGRRPDFIEGESLEETGIQSGFAFPILAGERVMAVLEFFSLERAEPDKHILEIMADIGAQLGWFVERIQAHEALHENEKRLKQSESMLADAERIAQVGSWEWDIKEDKVSWSAELYRIYGLEPTSLGFGDFLERVHPDDRPHARETIERAYATRERFEFFHRIIRPDGTVRLLHARGKVIEDDTGEPIRMIGTGQDVTELKQTEAELERKARHLTALSELGQAITASLELDEIFQLVLTTLRRLLGAQGIFILLLEGEDFVFAAADEIGEGSLVGQRVPVASGVAGEVIGTGRPVRVYGEEARRRVYRHIEETTGFTPAALLAAPLRLRGEWLGVMEAVHSEEDAFGADDLRLLEAAAAWTAIAIGNARLFKIQQEARKTAEVMHDAHQKLTRSLNVDDVFADLLEQLEQLTGCDFAAILLLERGSQLRVRAARGVNADDVLLRTLSVESYPRLQQVLSEHEIVSVADVQKDEDGQKLPGFPGEIRCYLVLPLEFKGDVGGVCLLGAATPQYFSRYQRLLAESLVGQASIALQNAQLFGTVRSSRQRLRYLTRKVVSAQEEERRRVSRELHDEAGQVLTALKLSLNAVKGGLPRELEASREELEEAIELTDRTMEKIRILAHDLRPPVLENLNLNDALEGLCYEFAERSELSIAYSSAELPSVSDPVAIAFYRFLQEALTNVVKHAEASQAHVVLDVDEKTIELSVIDDGRGFSPGSVVRGNQGIGLVGAQERLELLGGDLAIDSTPGQGTRVTACVPLETFKEEGKLQ